MQAHSQEETFMEQNHDGLNSNPGKACGCVVTKTKRWACEMTCDAVT